MQRGCPVELGLSERGRETRLLGLGFGGSDAPARQVEFGLLHAIIELEQEIAGRDQGSFEKRNRHHQPADLGRELGATVHLDRPRPGVGHGLLDNAPFDGGDPNPDDLRFEDREFESHDQGREDHCHDEPSFDIHLTGILRRHRRPGFNQSGSQELHARVSTPSRWTGRSHGRRQDHLALSPHLLDRQRRRALRAGGLLRHVYRAPDISHPRRRAR